MIRSIGYPAFVAGVLLLGACSGSGPGGGGGNAAGAPEEPASAGVTALLADVLGGKTALTYPALVERVGLPVRVRAEPVAGEAGVQPADTARTVVYYGMEVTLHEPASKPPYVARLALTDARHVSPEGLRVGYTREHILRLLGRPTRETASELFYERTAPRALTMVLFLERRAVSRIEWRLAGH